MVRRPAVVVVHNFKHQYLCNQWADHNEMLSEHYWDGGKAALGFGPDWIKTLVSMATNSSHKVIMEKTVWHFFSAVLHPILLYLQVMMTNDAWELTGV